VVPMTEIERTELEWLRIVNARTDAIAALVARDITHARRVAARAERTAKELWDSAGVVKEHDVHEALRYLNAAAYLASAHGALVREIKYHSPERPCCI